MKKEVRSQSRSFFRAFQLEGGAITTYDEPRVAIPLIFSGISTGQVPYQGGNALPSRNPAHFFGHFNLTKKYGVPIHKGTSQSRSFFRAFQLILIRNYKGAGLQLVAIPLIFSGISTKLADLAGCLLGIVAIPLIFSGISTNLDKQKKTLRRWSQSRSFFRAFQQRRCNMEKFINLTRRNPAHFFGHFNYAGGN